MPVDTFYLPRHIYDRKHRLVWESRITCHSLRHAFGTHLYEDRGDLLTIKALLRHKFLDSITIYVHLAANDMKRVINPFDRMGGDAIERF